MDKMTTCKVCGASIAKSATTCPQCGAKQKKRHPVLGIQMFNVLFLALFCYGATRPCFCLPLRIYPATLSMASNTPSSSTSVLYFARKLVSSARARSSSFRYSSLSCMIRTVGL